MNSFGTYLFAFLIGLETPIYSVPNAILGIVCLITLIRVRLNVYDQTGK